MWSCDNNLTVLWDIMCAQLYTHGTFTVNGFIKFNVEHSYKDWSPY